MGVTQLMTVREFIDAIQANAPDDAYVFVGCESAPIGHPLCGVALGGDAEGKALIIMSEPATQVYMQVQAIGFPYMLDRDVTGTDDTDADTDADTADTTDTAECPPLTDDDNERLDDFADFLDGLDN